MNRSLSALLTLGTGIAPAAADIPVIDKTNYAVARDTAEKTARFSTPTRRFFDRGRGDAEGRDWRSRQRRGIAEGSGNRQGLQRLVGAILDQLLKSGVADFGSLNSKVVQAATLFINGLQLVRSLSGKEDSSLASDKSYEELLKTVMGVSALINGSQQAVETRRSALETAGGEIGKAEDIRMIDQNTQLQVQTGLTLNEMIGVLNGGVQSLHAENQRKLTDMSNTRKALQYE